MKRPSPGIAAICNDQAFLPQSSVFKHVRFAKLVASPACGMRRWSAMRDAWCVNRPRPHLGASCALLAIAAIAVTDHLDDGVVIEGVVLACALVAFASLARTMRVVGPDERAAWRAAMIGIGLCVVAGMLRIATSGASSFPGPIDVVEVASSPCFAVALWKLRRTEPDPTFRAGWLDATMFALAISSVLWVVAVDASWHMHDMTERLLVLAFVLSDLVLLVMVLRTLLVGSHVRMLGLAALAALAAVVGDLMVVFGAADALTDVPGAQSCFACSYLAILAAALWRSAQGPAAIDPPAHARRGGLMVLVGTILVSALTPALSGIVAWRLGHLDATEGIVTLAAVLAMTGLVTARFVFVITDLGRTRAALQAATHEASQAGVLRGRLLDRAERALERERKLVAADLHDGPIQSLSALLYVIESRRDGLRGTSAELSALVCEGIGREVDALRRIMSGLRPPALDQHGVVSAIHDLARALFEGRDEEVMIDAERLAVDDVTDLVVYRLVQEGLINVARHAGATKVVVRVRAEVTGVHVKVVDDGRGFHGSRISQAERDGHFGLAAMRERVELCGGRWELVSAPGHGTRIDAWVPAQATRLGLAA